MQDRLSLALLVVTLTLELVVAPIAIPVIFALPAQLSRHLMAWCAHRAITAHQARPQSRQPVRQVMLVPKLVERVSGTRVRFAQLVCTARPPPTIMSLTSVPLGSIVQRVPNPRRSFRARLVPTVLVPAPPTAPLATCVPQAGIAHLGRPTQTTCVPQGTTVTLVRKGCVLLGRHVIPILHNPAPSRRTPTV